MTETMRIFEKLSPSCFRWWSVGFSSQRGVWRGPRKHQQLDLLPFSFSLLDSYQGMVSQICQYHCWRLARRADITCCEYSNADCNTTWTIPPCRIYPWKNPLAQLFHEVDNLQGSQRRRDDDILQALFWNTIKNGPWLAVCSGDPIPACWKNITKGNVTKFNYYNIKQKHQNPKFDKKMPLLIDDKSRDMKPERSSHSVLRLVTCWSSFPAPPGSFQLWRHPCSWMKNDVLSQALIPSKNGAAAALWHDLAIIGLDQSWRLTN